MGSGTKIIASGFVSMNEGEISDCYADIGLPGSALPSSFCYQNSGTIANAYLNARNNKNSLEFCQKNSGTLENTLLYDDDKGETELDTESWDLERIWEISGSAPTFQKKYFRLMNKEKDSFRQISTPEELYEIARKVNDGNADYAQGMYILTKDIDLKGKKWTPIGADELHPFSGRFDGNGYSIKNFTVAGKDLIYAGFFGYLKNSMVSNLNVDCSVKAGRFSGALAGCNDNGLIICCCAAGEVSSVKSAAGLVCRNTGKILRCFAVGRIRPLRMAAFFPLVIAGTTVAAAALVVGGVAIGNHFINQNALPAGTQFYPEVSRDPNIERNDDDPIKPASKGNTVTIEFQPEIKAASGTGDASFHYKNPGTSNHNVVVELQIADGELKDKVGTTGRPAEEQKKLEQAEGYSTDSSRVTIGKTGSIPPGYSVETITLEALADGTSLPAGDYNVVAYMLYYDMDTNEKAMMQTQIPAVLQIG